MATNIYADRGGHLNINTTPFGGVRVYVEGEDGDSVVIRLNPDEVEAFIADLQARIAPSTPKHTLRPGSDMFHTMDCPGCQDTPFTSSPRSETYWSS